MMIESSESKRAFSLFPIVYLLSHESVSLL